MGRWYKAAESKVGQSDTNVVNSFLKYFESFKNYLLSKFNTFFYYLVKASPLSISCDSLLDFSFTGFFHIVIFRLSF
jgi:hypothetical protein